MPFALSRLSGRVLERAKEKEDTGTHAKGSAQDVRTRERGREKEETKRGACALFLPGSEREVREDEAALFVEVEHLLFSTKTSPSSTIF